MKKLGIGFFVVLLLLLLSDCSSPASPSVPTTPTGLSATSAALSGGGDSITISWNAVTGATSYNLYDTKDGTTPTTTNFFKLYSISSPSEQLVDVSTGTTYQFAVSAINANGPSPLSSVASTTTP